ncbi:MAG: hypothetical protein K8I30_13470 [Anaerolineae bacterium]|nr:hypothetical protein [Anaerolineae bacterium]
MQERAIPLQVVMAILNDPEQIVEEQKSRQAYQSDVEINGKTYVVRLIVEADGTVVTVYRTSKVKKYRGE